jgi:hypothetical protein
MADVSNELEAQQEAARQRFLAAERTRQSKTRAAGVKIAVVGGLLNAVNVFVVVTQGRYFILTTLLGPAMMFLGIWLSMFGQPIDPRTGRPEKWAIVGTIGAIALGAALSIVSLVVLNGG